MEIDESKIESVINENSFHLVYDKLIFSTRIKCSFKIDDVMYPELQEKINKYQKVFIEKLKEGNIQSPVNIN